MPLPHRQTEVPASRNPQSLTLGSLHHLQQPLAATTYLCHHGFSKGIARRQVQAGFFRKLNPERLGPRSTTDVWTQCGNMFMLPLVALVAPSCASTTYPWKYGSRLQTKTCHGER